MPIFCDFSGVEVCLPNREHELHPTKVKLDGATRRQFYRSSVFPSQLIYCVYRGLLSAYFVAWFFVQVISKSLEGEQPKHFIYLTTWAEVALNLHLIASFLTCLYGYINESVDVSGNPSSTSSEIDLGNEKSDNELLSSGFSSSPTDSNELLWFHKLNWVLYTFAIDVGISVTISFWTLLRTSFDAFSWHCHLVNSVGILLDLIISDVPIRILHFTWAWIFGLSYIAMTWLLFKYSEIKFIYEETLDWGEWPKMTCAVVFGVCFVLVPGSHVTAHWIQRGRNHVLTRRYQKFHNSSNDISQDGFKQSDIDLEALGTVKCSQPPQGHQSPAKKRTTSGCYTKLENLPYSDM